MDKILFVLPLDERYVCSVHHGVLAEPVLSSSGQYVCKACLQDAEISNIAVNKELQDDINSLLCYCKYGVMVGSNGRLTADPQGCDHIIRFGNRAQHEAVCEFRDADFIMIDNSNQPEDVAAVPQVPQLLPCDNKDDGCFFLAASNDELDAHLNECSYERLRKLLRQSESRVALLERDLQLRDAEIAELRRLNEEKTSASDFAKRTLGNGKEMFEEFIRVLEEELPQNIIAIREQLLHSPAVQKSSSAFSSFKSKVITTSQKVRQDLSELHPLDNLAELRLMDKLSDIHPLEKLSEIHPLDRIAEMRPLERLPNMHGSLDKLIAILSTLKNDIVAFAAEYNTVGTKTDNNNNNNNNNNNDNNDNSNDNSNDNNNNDNNAEITVDNPTPVPVEGVAAEEDEDFKKQVAASLASFEEEKRQRIQLDAQEAVAVATAAVRSLQTS